MGKMSFVKTVFSAAVFRQIFMPGIGTVLFLIYLGFIGWNSLAPRKPEADPVRQEVGKVAVDKIVEEIRLNRGDISSAVLLHFENDPTDYMSNTLRNALDKNGILNLEDSFFSEKFRNMLNLRNRGVSSAEEALEMVKDEPVQGVFWGKIERFETVGEKVRLTGSWQLLDVKSGKVVCEGVINEDSVTPEEAASAAEAAADAGSAPAGTPAKWAPWYIRLTGFLLVVLLLPVLTISFIRTMVAKRSNQVNAFMLGIYTLVDALLAFLMVGASFTSAWPVVGFIVASLAALAYNYALMGFALKLES
ncbi:MAG: hypothetical protein E7047_08475 [Lentisphaerae bacterium]|nr:hypothetical protein [Lentisphaerota bacterium]